MNKSILIVGAIFGLLTVTIGAFGAHALKDILVENGRLETFGTGVKYHGLHALALLIIGILSEKLKNTFIIYSSYSMIVGILVFSGSLYALSITNITFLGAVTPIGGLLMMVGWVFLILAIRKGE